jgi:hypothetical protein
MTSSDRITTAWQRWRLTARRLDRELSAIRITTAWQRRRLTARRLDRQLSAIELAVEWQHCVESLRHAFAAYHGADVVTARFYIPDDYATFMQQIGGGWEWSAGLGSILLSAKNVASATTSTFQSLVSERSAEDDDKPEDDGLWLTIGYYSDRHETLLCCDRSHRYYGYVVDGHDDHPWLNGIYSGGCQVSAHSFAEWF